MMEVEFHHYGGGWYASIWTMQGKVLKYRVPLHYRLGYCWLEVMA